MCVEKKYAIDVVQAAVDGMLGSSYPDGLGPKLRFSTSIPGAVFCHISLCSSVAFDVSEFNGLNDPRHMTRIMRDRLLEAHRNMRGEIDRIIAHLEGRN